MKMHILDGFKAALFDLDGVIFDTEPQYTVFWSQTLKRYIPEEPDIAQRMKGQTLTQIFDAWFTSEREAFREEVTRALNAFEAGMTFPLVPGFLEFLSEVKHRGMKTAVVTSSNLPKMQNVYRHYPDFTKWFDAVLTAEDFAQSKPSPDCYLKAAARLGISPARCVVFEDSINGLLAGRAAKMFTVGLATTNPRDVVALLSDFQVSDYLEFLH